MHKMQVIVVPCRIFHNAKFHPGVFKLFRGFEILKKKEVILEKKQVKFYVFCLFSIQYYEDNEH